MKTRSKTGLSILSTLVFISIFGIKTYGGGNLYFKTASYESMAAVVFSSAEPSRFKVSIEDQRESVVYFSESKKSTVEYQKAFDFSLLKDGSYTLIATINGETTKRKFQVKDSKVTILEDHSPKYDDPVFMKIDDQLICRFENDFNEDVMVRFSDGNEIFFEDLTLAGRMLYKKYNLSKLPVGNYKVILSSGSYNYIHSLKID